MIEELSNPENTARIDIESEALDQIAEYVEHTMVDAAERYIVDNGLTELQLLPLSSAILCTLMLRLVSIEPSLAKANLDIMCRQMKSMLESETERAH